MEKPTSGKNPASSGKGKRGSDTRKTRLKEEEMTGEGIGESEMEELVPE